MADKNIRRDDKLLCGRLVAMGSTTTPVMQEMTRLNAKNGFSNIISIDFPAMPDTIELARSTEYYAESNLVMPDGIHQYKKTKPLEIPFSFRIHSFDEQYCQKGALTLLELAARLHSLVLPISTFGRGSSIVPVRAPSVTPIEGGGQTNAAQQEKQSETTTVVGVRGAGGRDGHVYAPVTCWLYLIWAGADQPGISAIGYVREVSVKFNGPWLRGPNNSFNLPTSADFSFTFIHRPGHGNAQPFTTSAEANSAALTAQTYADDVKDRLFNTRDLVYAANYQGFAANQTNETVGFFE